MKPLLRSNLFQLVAFGLVGALILSSVPPLLAQEEFSPAWDSSDYSSSVSNADESVTFLTSDSGLPSCGFQDGGQCGGTCPSGKLCKVSPLPTTAPPTGKVDEGAAWLTSPPATGDTKAPTCSCVDPLPCRGTGGTCGGDCSPASDGSPRGCYPLTIGDQTGCSCQPAVDKCASGFGTDGQFQCSGRCDKSQGGECVTNDAGDGCAGCADTCKASGFDDQGRIKCSGSCTKQGICMVNEAGDGCSCKRAASPTPTPTITPTPPPPPPTAPPACQNGKPPAGSDCCIDYADDSGDTMQQSCVSVGCPPRDDANIPGPCFDRGSCANDGASGNRMACVVIDPGMVLPNMCRCRQIKCR